MTNFSTNQVMQFYVLDGTAQVKPSITGDYAVITFTHADGEVVNSDRIENIMYGKLTKAAALTIPFTTVDIKLDATVNGGNPVVGQPYTVRVSYPEVGGLGIEGWVTKTATVTPKTAIAEDLYTELAKVLNAAFGAEAVLEAKATANGLSVSQKDLKKYYKRGVRPLVMPEFKVSAATILVEGVEHQPFAEESFKLTEADTDPISGVYKLADMEYFAMGERGDQYRNVDYINAIDTNYRVKLDGAYDVLVVHYAYKGANQNSHKSEKDLIIASTDADKLFNIAADLQRFAGITFTIVNTRKTTESILNSGQEE